ncbi:DNA phosphorothioation-dependent restriction protein DptG [Sediminibacillus massiliensis]|uniref:DNA phosphorothioation-dependent restriction protein DptG n=1 Tax=Sediminibacillus massiliensis TaxID=1926277 RepID=UPI0009884B39|nr:DNA phosphorothioation-dependent restriction protein DptG [Sediminibacillus massiliensis]
MAELYKDYLKELFEKKNKHDVGKAIDVLPFLSKRTRALRGRFNKVLGEYVRNICDLELDSKSLKKQDFYLSEDENEFSEHIAEKVEFSNGDDKYDFVRFLDQYLFNKEDIKLIHPFLFNYIKVDKKNKNEFSKYAQFMNDTLVTSRSDLKAIFNNKETEDILTELVLSQLDVLKETNEKGREYKPLLPSLSKLYQEDLMYLSKYKDYFLSSFPLLTQFYVFMYACQLVNKFERFTDADYDNLDPLYFSLEWESLSKRRQAAGELDSFKYIKEKLPNLFPHIHTMSQLSHNKANITEEELDEEKKKIDLLTYRDIIMLVEKGELNETQFYEELKEWVSEYTTLQKIDQDTTFSDLKEGMKELFQCLKIGMSSTVSKRYGENVEDIGANQFIKNRGSLGQVLNIKHDFLLLLTAVSVKENRVPLKELFDEFQKRGVILDRYTKKEVTQLLDNLNIIDKKSDSGDAQYVKPIL